MATAERVLEFEVIIEPDEDGFLVWCPALKGCQSFGLTRDEARANIREAIELWLEDEPETAIAERERISVKIR
jgi:predicted RNase H-like HicB family nuclease